MTGIVNTSLVPVRATDNERSEMTSQLLYGERVEILEVAERWLYVRNLSDLYTGWIDKKMIHVLPDNEGLQFVNCSIATVNVPVSVCTKISDNEKILLPAGSFLCSYDNGTFRRVSELYKINPAEVSVDKKSTAEEVIFRAKQFLNAPYLWGGKSILGVDCSGLVQLTYSLCGIQLPRDASMQVEAGRTIDFLFEATAGDLAYFENSDGKVIHVGILLNSSQIIHASDVSKSKISTHKGLFHLKQENILTN